MKTHTQLITDLLPYYQVSEATIFIRLPVSDHAQLLTNYSPNYTQPSMITC